MDSKTRLNRRELAGLAGAGALAGLGARPAAADPKRIITLGDSITKGVRPGVTREQTFTYLLEAKLHEAGLECMFTNQGIGGERTDQALVRLDRDILSLKPQWVLIMYGTNDSYVDIGKTEPRITQIQYRENLKELTRRIRGAVANVVLMTPPRWSDEAMKNGVGENPNLRLEPYVEACREAARELELPLVDHYRFWTEQRMKGVRLHDWTTDGCHPNPAGHVQLTEQIYNVVRRIG